MVTLHLDEFYESISLSLMDVVCDSSCEDRKFGSLVIECDDFDEVSIKLNWLACKKSENQDLDSLGFINFKEADGWLVGFKKCGLSDSILNIELLDDSDKPIDHEKMGLIFKEFLHENFLWEKYVFSQFGLMK